MTRAFDTKSTCAAAVACVALALMACKKDEPVPTEPETSGATAPAIQVGDTVIARWSSTSYYEGSVSKIVGTTYTIAWGDKSQPKDLPASDVFALPKAGADPGVAEGGFVLAKWGSSSKWYGAKVLSSGGSYEVVYTSDASEKTLSPHEVMKAPDHMTSHLKKSLATAEMLKAARAAGKPAKPSDWKPKPGEAVAAVWAAHNWYNGTVVSTNGSKTKVKWKDQSAPSDVAMDGIAPMPKASSPKAKSGDYLIAKPTGSFSQWSYGQATGVSGDSVTATLQDGSSRSLSPGDYWVLR